MVFFKNYMSEKTGNIFVGKDHNNFCQEILCAFLDNSPKILRLVRKLLYNVFLQIHEKSISIKIFEHIKYKQTFGNLLSQLVKAMINCLLTGLAFTVPGFTSRWPFHTALASSGCVKDLRLVNQLVQLSHLLSKQSLLNNKFYALIHQL